MTDKNCEKLALELFGKIISYDFGGSKPIVFRVNFYRINENKYFIDDEEVKSYNLSVSEDNVGFYTIYENNYSIID